MSVVIVSVQKIPSYVSNIHFDVLKLQSLNFHGGFCCSWTMNFHVDENFWKAQFVKKNATVTWHLFTSSISFSAFAVPQFGGVVVI